MQNLFTLDKILLTVTALATSTFIYIIQWHFFLERPADRNAESPASFFRLSGIASRSSLLKLSATYAFPFAAVFFLIAVQAKPLVDAIMKLLSQYVLSLLNASLQEVARGVISEIPAWVNPLLVLSFTLILFAPYIRGPMAWIRNTMQYAMGIESCADQVACEAAARVLKVMDYESATKALASAFRTSVPLPEELARSPETDKLAYQILYFSEAETRRCGAALAVRATVKCIGVEQEAAPRTVDLTLPHLVSSLTFYILLCVLYVVFVPTVGPSLTEHFRDAHFIWPLPDFRWDLARTLAQYTLAFVVPFALGIYLYGGRRMWYAEHETKLQSFIIVFDVQLLTAFVVNLAFWLLLIASAYLGNHDVQSYSIADFRVWANLIGESLAPGITLFVWIACRERGIDGIASVGAVCIGASLAFYMCQYAYECLSQQIGLYWHQMLLGGFLTFCYYVTAAAAKSARSGRLQPAEVAVGGAAGLAREG